MRVLIAGCGYVGTRLGLELAGRGHEVSGLRRDPSSLPAPIRPLRADLSGGSLRGLPEADAIVYAASADESSEAAYRRAYVDGLGRLLDAVPSSPSRVIFVSSTGVYGQQDGEWVDERSPAEPGRFTGRILLEGETLALASGARATVVRLVGIYGPGRDRMIREVRERRARSSEHPPQYGNRIHRDDCAGFLAHLLHLDEPESLYVGADDDPAPLCEVYRWIARRIGAPPPALVPPAGTGRPLRSHKRCRNDRLRASGYALRFPTFREGYGALLEAERPDGD